MAWAFALADQASAPQFAKLAGAAFSAGASSGHRSSPTRRGHLLGIPGECESVQSWQEQLTFQGRAHCRSLPTWHGHLRWRTRRVRRSWQSWQVQLRALWRVQGTGARQYDKGICMGRPDEGGSVCRAGRSSFELCLYECKLPERFSQREAVWRQGVVPEAFTYNARISACDGRAARASFAAARQ